MRKLLIGIMFAALLGSVWTAAAQSEPEDTPIVIAPELLARADAAFNTGDYERATLDYSLFLLFNPTISQAYYFRALSYVQLGDFDTAIGDVSEALALNPSAPDYRAELYFLRAQIHLQKDNLNAALGDLDASIEASPALGDNLLLRARVYAFQERYADAILDFDRALEINPENAQGYVDRALVHNAQSDFDLALSDVNRALDLNPDSSGLYLLRGAIHNQAEHAADAASDYLRWLELTQTRENRASDTLTTSQQFVVEMTEGVVYNIPFTATAGQTVNVTANRTPNGEVDPLMVILDNRGAALVSDDDSGGNMDAFIENYVIPRDGDYTLLVGHAGGGANGDILVSLDLDN